MARNKNRVQKGKGSDSPFHILSGKYMPALQHLYYLAITSETRSQATISAFEALFLIGGYWRFDPRAQEMLPNGDLNPHDQITVPFWVINTLIHGWLHYLEKAPPGMTIGESLGIEGGSQGKKPAKESWKLYRRDLLLALRVMALREDASQEGRKLSLEMAYGNVAAEHGVSDEIVKRAWRKHQKQIKESRKFWGMTSGSDARV